MEAITGSKTGTVFNIQRFSVHDGPGIRTIVFLKGCPLRCLWCSNPESQNPVPTAEFGKIMSVDEVMRELKKDQVHYRRSGGGITFSGGEPLMHADFVTEIIHASRSQGWHTAMETTGFAADAVLRQVIPELDLVLLDIKAIPFSLHKKFTGVSSKLILQNALTIGEMAKEVAVRIPVIPTFNATEENINYICEFVKQVKHVSRIHLLPYHNYGENKYELIGMKYKLKHLKNMTSTDLEPFKEIVEGHGITCVLGG
ncbi:pyruvate formate lyase activating enzyme [Evansella caseinilytica]|uniref:Pyruvate formate lyase activating enzyme n=1 Tax=Evansella caseinilytica TaxID=1503961 RepID=A0A1H3HVZ2_9BACI|nr:glycyl-radical enzyme activating protein [Evansella caseinilytica]SDY19673.1 pyruvate formate lyase activating enzyme [Evansella caseinilytica]